MARLDEILPDDAVVAIEPQIDGRRTASDAEVEAALRLAADGDVLGADELQQAGEFLAGIHVENGDLLVVIAGVGELPVAGGPHLLASDTLLAVDAEAELVVLGRGADFRLLAVVVGAGLETD